jgi:protein-L-isoaspartate(D-aspartate) O-methyltransferase
MVQEQIAARGIADPRVLAAMREVPRHLFVEPDLADRAYEDAPLPIAEGQTISQPYMVGLMSEALELEGAERILEIGTGSGYQTAILSRLCRRVFTIETLPTLALQAEALLKRIGCDNVVFRVGDGTLGWPEEAPFDAILVTAGAPDLPRPLLEQLAVDGVMVIPVGEDRAQVLKRVRRTPGGMEEEDLGECRFVKLLGKHGWAH